MELLRGPRRHLVLAVAAVALVAGAALAGRAFVLRGSTPTPTPSPAAPRGFVTFRDAKAGVSLSYPKGWKVFGHNDRQVKLVAGPGEEDYVLLRVIPLNEEISQDSVPTLRSTLDPLVQGNNVKILNTQEVELGGLRGWHYLYTFVDEGSGQQGVHSHYFIFNGAKIDVLVFQALPEADFEPLARTFDQVAATFRSTRRRAPSPDPAAPTPAAPAPTDAPPQP